MEITARVGGEGLSITKIHLLNTSLVSKLIYSKYMHPSVPQALTEKLLCARRVLALTHGGAPLVLYLRGGGVEDQSNEYWYMPVKM